VPANATIASIGSLLSLHDKGARRASGDTKA